MTVAVTTGESAIARAAAGFRSPLGTPIGVGILTALIALIGSWNVSLWLDEAASISGATRSLGDLSRLIHHVDIVHAAYYVGLHFWTEAFGTSPLALRMPSALAAGMAATGVAVLGRQLGGPSVGTWGAVVFAVLPRVTWMGIEARSFGLTATCSVWLTVALVSAMRRPRWWLWSLYGAGVAISIVLNIYVALLVLAHAVSVLVKAPDKRSRVAWLLAAGPGALVSSPVVLEATRQTGQIAGGTLTWADLVQNAVVNQWFLGGTPTQLSGAPARGMTGLAAYWQPAALALAAVCLALVAWKLVAAILRGRRASELLERMVWWLLPWIIVPTLVIGGYSVLIHNLYNPRYLTFATPAMALLIGTAISLVARRWARLVAAAVIVVLALPVYVSQREVYGKSNYDWSVAAAFVDDHKSAREGLYLGPGEGYLLESYPEAFTGLRDLTFTSSAEAGAALLGNSRDLEDAQAELSSLDGVWVVRLNSRSADIDADRELLGGLGFRPVDSWRGPLSTVIQYGR